MCTRIKALWQNLLLIIISTLIAAIFAEVALRIALPSPIVWKYPQEQYRYDAEIGHWLEPNQKAYTHDKVVITNSVGIRDSEYSLEVAPGVYRVLALGDSQTFGNGLELADTWPKQLETILSRAGNHKKIEVLNIGLPGSDTWQHELILDRMLSIYRPDAVVLAFYVNDIVKRFIPRQVNKSDNEFSKRFSYLLKQSAFLLTLRTAWSSATQLLSPSQSLLEQQALLAGEDSAAISERWQQVDHSLSLMKMASIENNAFFGIVLLPRRDQIDGRLSWNGYSSRVMEIAEQQRIPLVSLLPVLRNAHKIHGKGLFIPWDGHNSKIANQVIAQEIADKMLTDEIIGLKINN